MTGLLKIKFYQRMFLLMLILALLLAACSMGTKAGAAAGTGATSEQPQSPTGKNIVNVAVKNDGYSPEVTHAKAGEAAQLVLESKNVHSCSLSFVIPELSYEKLLPVTGQVVVDIPAHDKGTVLRYTCSMGMYTGEIHFDKE